jgi:hypothetical protein
MFVHKRAFVVGKFQDVAGIAHGESERGGLGGVQTAKINGHEQRGHLVVGNFSGGEVADELLESLRREKFSFALVFD